MIIGIDIGGWKIRGILWDGKKILRSYEVSTPRRKAEFVRTIHALLGALAFKRKIRGVGIAVAGIVEGSRVKRSPNVPYLNNFDIRSLHSSWHLMVDNDARAFLRGELRGREAKSVLGFTIGTGIGRAWAENGRVRKIKKIEYPERWEKEYQKIRDGGDDGRLARFLGEKLSKITEAYNPRILVFGGGVLGRKRFFTKLKTECARRGVTSAVIRAKREKNSAALGAALLFHG